MGYSQQVKEDAAKAAEYLREHGWCQGWLKTEDGRCCASGAMGSVTEGLEVTVAPRWMNLAAAFSEIVEETVPVWNDKTGRTQEEVLAVFDRIANS